MGPCQRELGRRNDAERFRAIVGGDLGNRFCSVFEDLPRSEKYPKTPKHLLALSSESAAESEYKLCVMPLDAWESFWAVIACSVLED